MTTQESEGGFSDTIVQLCQNWSDNNLVGIASGVLKVGGTYGIRRSGQVI